MRWSRRMHRSFAQKTKRGDLHWGLAFGTGPVRSDPLARSPPPPSPRKEEAAHGRIGDPKEESFASRCLDLMRWRDHHPDPPIRMTSDGGEPRETEQLFATSAQSCQYCSARRLGEYVRTKTICHSQLEEATITIIRGSKRAPSHSNLTAYLALPRFSRSEI